MHKMVEDMIEEAIAEVRIPSNSVKYQAAVTLPPITTMLVKGRLDPSLKIQATIEEPPLIEPPIRAVHQSEDDLREFQESENFLNREEEKNEDLESFLDEEFPEETADPVDYSIEYSSESYDESSYEYAGSGDYASSSSSSSLTDDESLQGADERNRVHLKLLKRPSYSEGWTGSGRFGLVRVGRTGSDRFRVGRWAGYISLLYTLPPAKYDLN